MDGSWNTPQQHSGVQDSTWVNGLGSKTLSEDDNITLNSWRPMTTVMATTPALPRKRMKVPTELMAATLNTLDSRRVKARRAPLQKLYP